MSAVLGMLAAGAVWAGGPPAVRIEAAVSEDLRVVDGTLWISPEGPDSLIDPLARLPTVRDDLQLVRTWPGRPERGRITWERVAEGQYRFHTVLPRRYGALGATRRHGLFANGAWYPQPSDPGDPLPILTWDVSLTLPPGTAGVVGAAAGSGALRWTGTADRASAAVVPRGVLTPLRAHGVEVDLLTRGRPRKVLVRELTEQLPMATAGLSLRGVVVVGPLRRRLVYPGAGVAYLSDRAFRLTPGLERFHRVAVVRGLAGSLLDEPDPFERGLAAAAVSADHQRSLRGEGADTWLRRFRWIPQVDWVLSSERMPFYAEILERVHPGDPVHDDLAEILEPSTPGPVVFAQLDDTWGPGAGYAVARAVARGVDSAEAAAAAGVDPAWLEAWRAPYPDQDYTLDEVHLDPPALVISRRAPPDAQQESLPIRIDDQVVAWKHPGGTATLDLAERPSKVVLDPLGHVAQRSRVGDTWPPRFTVTFAAWLDNVNLNQLQFYGTGAMTLRRQGDTHNLWSGRLSTQPGILVAGDVAYLRKEGPLLDGISRPHRFSISVGSGLLDPSLANVDRLGRFSVTTGGGYAWDTRVSHEFPLRGRRFGLSAGVGAIPGLDEQWATSTATAVGVLSPHPRHAFAGRATLSVAASNVSWRLLRLGGPSAMRSLPVLPGCPSVDDDGVPQPCADQFPNRAFAAVEYRVAPLRNASVPLLLAWGNELQLTGGIEGVVAREGEEIAQVLGVTAGLGAIADILGAEPTMMGITAGWPTWWRGVAIDEGPVPQLYLRWGQAF